jgi:hypothetical protein
MPAAMAQRVQRAIPFTPFIPFAMTLLLLEALGALILFVFIVWWTMFSGRRKGELPSDTEDSPAKAQQQDPPAR